MTDWRALCEELADALDHNRQCLLDDRRLTHPLADKARAALAEPDGPAVQSREPASVVGEPSDAELLKLMPEQFREDLATVSRMAAHGAGTGVTPGLFRVSLNTGALDYARAVLARWGHQPAPVAEGEVAELVKFLRDWGDDYADEGTEWHRAAELLERQAAPVPVAVSERLPGPEDCNEDGECWAWRGFDPDVDDDGEFWQLTLAEWLDEASFWTHWLPAHALPLPSGEVEHG